jgi:hypothetical protein
MGYEELYESLKIANEQLQKRNELLEHQNNILVMEKKQWEQEKVVQQQVIQQTLNTANANNNQILEENRRLKDELQRLQNGNHD